MVEALVKHLQQEELTFKELEELLFKFSLNLFQHLMVETLGEIDQKLMEDRDKSRYQSKEINERTIQTLVGEMTFNRRYYWDQDEKRWVYLLDEALEIEEGKTIGPGLLKLGVTWATKGPSYRDARDRLTDVYGSQVLSHEAIRQALLEVGAACDRELENEIITVEGQRRVKTLFIEVDGFGAYIQKNEKLGRKNGRREAKMAVIHEGWAPRSNGKEPDYKLVRPQHISNLKKSEDFWECVRGYLSAHYKNIDETLIVINGDGAPWIRKGTDSFAYSMYQYNRYHVARDIRTALRPNKKSLRRALDALDKNDMGTLLYIVTEAWSNCTDQERKEKLEDLKDTIFEDSAYIKDYRSRLKQKGFAVPDDWRGLGAAESNVNKYKNRTGKRGRAWSDVGLAAILTTLSRLFKGNLHGAISRTLEDKEEWILDKITSGAGYVARNIQSDSLGVRAARFPATRRGTQGYSKLFRRLQEVQFE